MTLHHNHVPAGTRSRANWVGWRYETRDGKKTKVPINPHTGQRAKANDPTTWSDYETAVAAVEKHGLEGVGYVFAEDDPFSGVDIDDCREPETGVIAPWAQEIIDSLATYTEVSPSGTGLKCWLAGAMSGTRHRWKLYGGEVEIYDRLRFFTFTGEHLAGAPVEIEERQAEFEALIAKLDEQLAASKPAKKSKSAGGRRKKADVSDEVALKRLRAKEKYRRLLDGDYSDYGGDHSSGDLVLCGEIARVVGPDPERIDGIFRKTKGMRAKWDEPHRADGATYGEMVIEKALEGYAEPPKRESQKETLLAMADGLRARMGDMRERLERIEAASAKKREVAQAVMEDAGIEKILEPDFTVSLRVSQPGVAVINEAEIPEPYWIPQPPKLDRKGILDTLKTGVHVPGATFTNAKVSLAIRTK